MRFEHKSLSPTYHKNLHILNKKNTSDKRRIWFDLAATLAIAGILIGAYYMIPKLVQDSNTKTQAQEQEVVEEQSLVKFGFDLEKYVIEPYKMMKNQFVGDILYQNGISYTDIAELENAATDVYNVRKIRAGKNYHLIRKDTCGAACAFVYEPDPLRYVVYDLRGDSVEVSLKEREFVTCIETASGRVESSLWNAMTAQDLDYGLVDLMEDALASSVDFHRTQYGDEFKLVYERKYIEDKPVSLGNVLGAYYKNEQGEYYSIWYENDNYEGYFDGEGRPTKKAFLRSPVRYSRISSRFSYSRFHPIKKRRIPHLGTDYAAPYGTPIRAVADGVVTKATYARNNGKYVKIKHDRTYETQYLHMQKFAAGIRPGVKVTQGQTIGYVGSTGLATGPHVCFRFWKNGKQVNHLRENFPPPEPMEESELPEFYRQRNLMKNHLDMIEMADEQVMADNQL